MASRPVRIVIFALYLALILALIEAALRLQQRLGPFIRLEFGEVSLDAVSQTLNHRNPPGLTQDLIQYWHGLDKVRRTYDEDGIRVESLRPKFGRSPRTVTVLFMGDSFIEGLDDAHTVPQYIWEYYQKTSLAGYPINLLNAGASSYAPVIFIVQAKQLIPKLKPDIVVVDIDETDIVDDTTRYEGLVDRDSQGNVVRVRPSPIYFKFLNGFLEIQKQPLYLSRLIMKFYHTRIYIPRMTDYYPQGKKLDQALHGYLFGLGGESEMKYAPLYPGFRRDVDELIRTLTGLLGDKTRILLLYHSNTRRIQNKTKADSPVSKAVREASEAAGTAYYDASRDLTAAFTGDLNAYYAPDDLRHFGFEGMRIYSELVARKLEPLVRAVIRSKDQGQPF